MHTEFSLKTGPGDLVEDLTGYFRGRGEGDPGAGTSLWRWCLRCGQLLMSVMRPSRALGMNGDPRTLTWGTTDWWRGIVSRTLVTQAARGAVAKLVQAPVRKTGYAGSNPCRRLHPPSAGVRSSDHAESSGPCQRQGIRVRVVRT